MRKRSICALLLTLVVASGASAWNSQSHSQLAEAATLALPTEMPEFFRWGAAQIAHTAVDPDVMKQRDTPQLRHREYPEHFLDYELVSAWPLPELRYDFVALAIRHRLAPDRVGFVPYAVTENTQRLTLAFAEHRCWPEDPYVRAKALVYAGILAHYATDMIQPLHTSVHYDGRALADGASPHTGIHRKVDGLFEQPGFEPPPAPAALPAYPDLWRAVRSAFDASHARVDDTYALEERLDRLYEHGEWSPELEAFANERYARTVEFLASLYWTAWRRSSDVERPGWWARPGPDGTPRDCPSG